MKKMLTLRLHSEKFGPHTETTTATNMRTNTLLVAAAALSAGVLASSAQVYSVNTVGYVNQAFIGGAYTAVTPPLQGTNMHLSVVLAGATDFTTVLLYNSTISDYDTYTLIGGTWAPEDPVVNVGIGMLVNPTDSFTNTFVGDVMQGTLTNSYPAGYSLRGSMVPQAGTADVLGLTAALQDFDSILQWDPTLNGGAGDWNTYTLIGGGWVPSMPSLSVAEAVLVSAAAPGNWVRSFTVSP